MPSNDSSGVDLPMTDKLERMARQIRVAPQCEGCEHLPHGDAPCLLCSCGHAVPEPKGSASSSPPEGDKCAACGCPPAAHMGRPRGCTEHGPHDYEKPGSTSSSPDEHQCCGHWVSVEHPDQCCICDADTPADAETAGEPECAHVGSLVLRDSPLGENWTEFECPSCGAEWRRTWDAVKGDWAPEPEAPVCRHPRPREITRGDTHSSFICDECDQTWDMYKAAPPRPPFLVAYATGSGALNELALPGEASVAVVDGSLVISHASGVLGIAHVKPLEMDN